MNKGLEALKELPATTLEEAEAIDIIEKELKEHEEIKEIIIGMYEDTFNMINYLEERRKKPNNLVDENKLLKIFGEKDAYKKIIDLFEDKKSVENYIEQGLEIAQLKYELVKYEKYKLIEEELGIDLATLFKGLKNGIYVRNSQGIRGYNGNANSYLSFGYDIVMKSFYFTMKVKGVQQYFIKDYGKTWALTKEELENV